MSKTISSDHRRKRLRQSVPSQKRTMSFNEGKEQRNDGIISKKKTSKLSDSLRAEILNSPDAAVEIIYPLLGKILKKYVNIKLAKFKKVISLKRLTNSVSQPSLEVNTDAIDLDLEAHPRIQKVMLIEKHSGHLLSEFSNTLDINDSLAKKIHKAIVHFVGQGNESSNDLQRLDIEGYTIHIQFVSNYFMAVVVSGGYNWTHRDLLEDKILNFAQHQLVKSDFNNKDKLTKKLAKFFKKVELIVY